MTVRRLLLLLILLLVSCAPPVEEAAQPLPTLHPSPTPPVYNIDGAERTARLFLDAWQNGDFEEMYDLTTFANQEATPLERFREIYEGVYSEMTLQSLSYVIRHLYRETEQVAVLNYDVTFDTNILGEFTDANRDMRLTIDRRAGEWRVAWSPGDIFAEMGNGARLRFDSIIPRRANIYDRDGALFADQNGRIVSVNVIKQEMPQYEGCVNTLAQVFDQEVADVREELDDVTPDWRVEAGKLEPAPYEQNRQLLEDNCNAEFDTLFTRRYLRGRLAPHVVGYVGYMNEDELPEAMAQGFHSESILGRIGIESSWDEMLRGQPGGRLILASPTGERLRVLTEAASVPSEAVWLTLDLELQQFALQAIGESYANAADSWAPGSRGAAAVVIDVNTGEILAMVSWPSFDANALTPFPAIGRETADEVIESLQDDPSFPLLNRATQGLYRSGSVMKIATLVAVADSGVYQLDEPYVCTGVWQRGNDFRSDWSTHGALTLPGALTQSCNTYFYEAGMHMFEVDPSIHPTYARMMGLGVPTGLLDLAESAGAIPGPDWLRETYGQTWTASMAISMSIGEGFVQVTPLQVARMTAAIANGGTLYRPQMVLQTGLTGDAFSYVFEPEEMSYFDIRPEVMAVLREGMCGVTTERAGTATHIFRDSPLQDLGVCGKTGTAEAINDGDLPNAWFTAYAPREEPEIAVAVIVENSGDGSAVAAPIVRRVMEFYFYGEG